MSLSFDLSLALPGRILFGAGTLARIGEEIARLVKGKRLFVITGAGVERAAPLFDSLREAGFVWEQSTVAHEPEAVGIEVLSARARAFAPDGVIGFGGGSVLDAAKAVAAMAVNPGPLTEYVEVVGKGLPLPVAPLPVIAVPTTSGTGSEATRNAVIAFPERRVKVSLRHAGMIPRLALLDPDVTAGAPRSVAVASGLDAVAQLLESFVTLRANPITDGLCREGLVRAGRAFPAVLEGRADSQAREGMAFAALASGITLANAGLGAVHGLAGPLGGFLDKAPHGALCAILLPHCLRENAAAGGEAVQVRYAEAAGLLFGKHSLDVLLARLEEWNGAGEIVRLGAYGLKEGDLSGVAAQALESSSMKGNPVKLSVSVLEGILRAAL